MPVRNRRNIMPLCLLMMLYMASPTANAQDLSLKISLTPGIWTLSDVLTEISNRGHINFTYNPREIPIETMVNVKTGQQKTGDWLDNILTPLGIQYFVVESQVVLKKITVHPAEPVAKAPPGPELFTLSGSIRDKANGEVLIGAYAVADSLGRGTTSNVYGFYSLTLPRGIYRITFSFLGYRSYTAAVVLNSNLVLSAELEENRLAMGTVEIRAESRGGDLQSQTMSRMHFSPALLSSMPGFAGDIDILKTLQAVPGIKAFGDGSAMYFVRGGSSDQNLLLIDEVPVYNPSHLFGFFSALSPKAIKDVSVYKGDFPAAYGGRLSSVIDVRARDGNMKRFGFGGNLGPFASDLAVEGPVARDKSSFFLSTRRSNLGWLSLPDDAEQDVDIRFYDLNAKLNLRVNGNNRIFFTLYAGEDEFSRLSRSSIHTFGISWDNFAGALRWNHLFSNRLFSNTTLSYSAYNYYLYISREQDDYWQSGISYLNFKTDLSWYPAPGNIVKAGLEAGKHYSQPGNMHFSDPETQSGLPYIPEYHAREYACYLSHEYQPFRAFKMNYGIRLSLWQSVGPATVYYYNQAYEVSDTLEVSRGKAFKTYVNPQPRISVEYSFSGRSRAKLSYSRTAQYLQLLTNSTGPFTSLEVWVPSGLNLRPQTSDQYALGLFHSSRKSDMFFSAEAFDRMYQRQVDYKDHADLLFNPLLEGELRFGSAEAYGLEMMARKSEGRLTGWIAYTFTRSLRTFSGLNGGKTYPANWDRPHDLCIFASLKGNSRWSFSAAWYYLSGSPVSIPSGFYQYNGYSVPVYGEKNDGRLPDYHRLDLNIAFSLNRPENRDKDRHYRHSLVLTLYNVYGRWNPFSLGYNRILDDDGNLTVPANLYGDIERLPTSISIAGLIPSLNYNFQF